MILPRLSMDAPTRKLSRTDRARVCVELDLLRLWIGVEDKGFWQVVKYEKCLPVALVA